MEPATHEVRVFGCESCGAQVEFEPHQRATVCPYCASPQVLERPELEQHPNPTFVVGFSVTDRSAAAAARKWIKGKLFAPGSFRRAEPGDIKGIYVPAYLYSSSAHSRYSAQIGEEYTVTRTNSKGQVRTETRTEWRNLSGEHACYVADVLVTASKGIPNNELEAVEPYLLGDMHRYTKKLVAGFIAEEPSLTPDESAVTARNEAGASIGRRLGRFMPGDKHRRLDFTTHFADEHLDSILLPLWVLPVRWSPDEEPVRLLVNGQTGKTWGKAPTSTAKVLAVVFGGMALLAVILLLSGLLQ